MKIKLCLIIIIIVVSGITADAVKAESTGISPRSLLLYKEGLSYAGEGKLYEALEKLAAASALNPGNVEILVDLGWVYGELNRNTDALNSYRKALELNPDYAPGLNNLGYILIQDKKTSKEGLKHIQKASRLDPANIFYLDSLAEAREKNGDLNGALDAYRKAMELNPHYLPILKNLRDFAERIGNKELQSQVAHNIKVLESVKKSEIPSQQSEDKIPIRNILPTTMLNSRPPLVDSEDMRTPEEYDMAVKRYNAGDYESAEKLFQAVILRMRNNDQIGISLVEAYRFLGLINAKSEKWKESREYWKQSSAVKILNLIRSWAALVDAGKREDSLSLIERIEIEANVNLKTIIKTTKSRHLEGRSFNPEIDNMILSLPTEIFAELRNSHHFPWLNRAKEYIKSGKYEKAALELETVLNMRDAGTEANVLYSWVALKTERYTEAWHTIKEGLKKNGGLEHSAWFDSVLAALYLITY